MAIDLVDVANGTGGFVIHGEAADDSSGFSVASAGDINGDGFDDLIIGAPGGAPGADASYVVFGKAGGFDAEIDLANLGARGFVIRGSGFSVASAGDIKGDGFDDLIIGAPDAFPDITSNHLIFGGSFVVFGKASGFAAIDLLAGSGGGTEGFAIGGELESGFGRSVASPGDINGDGFDDLIIGAPNADGPGNTRDGAGASYVVFGKAGGFHDDIDLAAVAAGSGGFVIHGALGTRIIPTWEAPFQGDHTGFSVASAGDFNGDGFDDLIIGAPDAFPDITSNHLIFGGSFVVFGKASGFAAIDLLAGSGGGTEGFAIGGELESGFGRSVASAGDINGDGFDDLIIGGGGTNPYYSASRSYVVFGQAGGFSDMNYIRDVDGFAILGEDAYDASGRSVASAGDINGDGFDDLIIGAQYADGPGNARTSAGDSYVVFGKAGGFGNAIDLADIAAGTGGFVIHGEEVGDFSGRSVASAGDIDGDGFDDLIIGADGADGPGNARDQAGGSYVLFGSATIGGSANAVTHLGDATSQTLTGDGNANVMVGGRGDDTLLGNGSADVLRGGEGDDTLTISDANFQRITGGTGNDKLAFSGGITLADTDFRSVEGIEGIKLANGVTNLTLGVIASHAIGGLAADSFRITLDASSVLNAAVTIDGSALQRGLRANLSSNSAAIDLTGGAGADLFTGGSASDALNGGANHDVLNGGAAADALSGGAGNDSYFVDNAGDTIVETAGTDNVNASVSYVLGAGVAVEMLRTVNAAATTAINLTGNNLANIVTGNAGNNVLDGGGGIDTLQGLGGNDSYFVDSAADQIVDAAGIDNVNASVSYTLGAGVAVETLRTSNAAGTAAINLTGNELANILTGNAGANILDGRGGADTMQGLAGNDSYFVDHANDKVIEAINAGTDLVRSTVSITLGANVENTILIGAAAINGVGNALNNTIIGNSANNTLNGHSGNDRLSGAGGNDFLVGGAGKDTMTGGASNDRFDFNSVADIGNAATRDVIDDFTHLIDRIDLSTIDANGAAAGNTAFSFLASHGAAFTGVAGQLRWFQSDAANNANDMTIVAGDINGDSVADFQIQLTGLKTLAAADFIL